MTDLLIRVQDEHELAEVLPQYATPVRGGYRWRKASHAHHLVLVGPIVVEPAVYDMDFVELTPAVMDDRYHAGLRILSGPVPEIPEYALLPNPEHPRRRWL